MLQAATFRKLSLFVCLMVASRAVAQTGPPQPGSADQNNPQTAAPQLTVFPHPDAARYLISGQANIIFQAHPGFHSPYEGANSLLGRGEYKTSLVGTLYLGLRVHKNLRYNTDVI